MDIIEKVSSKHNQSIYFPCFHILFVDCPFHDIVACQEMCAWKDEMHVKGTECTGCECKGVCEVITGGYVI